MNGHKNDNGKARMDLISPSTLLEIGEVLAYGAKRYGDNNWKKVAQERHFAAALRHINKFWAGEKLDKESGCHHIVHALTDLFFVREIEREYEHKTWTPEKG